MQMRADVRRCVGNPGRGTVWQGTLWQGICGRATLGKRTRAQLGGVKTSVALWPPNPNEFESDGPGVHS